MKGYVSMSELKLTKNNFSLYKNQKAFRIRKARQKINDNDVRVSDIFREDILLASKNLTDTAFKIYMYFMVNQNDFIGGLSKEDVIAKTGISESSYKRGIALLTEKGYLIYTKTFISDKDGTKAPLYDFIARPDLVSN